MQLSDKINSESEYVYPREIAKLLEPVSKSAFV